jgi:hypothetical protein
MIDILRLRTHGVDASFVARAFQDSEDLHDASWSEWRDRFDRSGAPYSYGLEHELSSLGHSTVDLVLDLAPVRDAWVREHGPLPPARSERQALAIAAIQKLQPRIVVDLNLKTFDATELRDLRRRFPFLQATVGIVNTMKRLDRIFGHDLLLTPSSPLIRKVRRAGGPPGRVFHHAFDPEHLPLVPPHRDGPPVVLGTIGPGLYARREALVRELLSAGVAEAWVREALPSPKQPGPPGGATARIRRARSALLAALPLRLVGALHRRTGRAASSLDRRLLERVGLRIDGEGQAPGAANTRSVAVDFPERCHGPVFGAEMFALLSRTPVAVHHEMNPSSTSLRHFEATGMGATLVTNAVAGLEEVFVPGEEVVVFRDAREAVGLLRWLQRDASASAEIGARGQARTLRDHTVKARAAQLAGILSEVLESS